MFRLMGPSDLTAVKELWAACRQDPADWAEKAIRRFAGEENVWLAEENGEVQAALLAVPVTLQGRPGRYLCGLCSREERAAAGLLDVVCAELAGADSAFLAAAPGAAQAALYAAHGLWSQAEFDAVTAKKLCELRRQYCPGCVELDAGRMAVVLGDLYARGVTIVSNARGYGLYFRQDDTLYFPELMAEDDRAAEVLMEAARQKEVVVEKAVVTVGADQPLFYGEGTRQEYGMIRFAAAPFDLTESYMRLMLAD